MNELEWPFSFCSILSDDMLQRAFQLCRSRGGVRALVLTYTAYEMHALFRSVRAMCEAAGPFGCTYCDRRFSQSSQITFQNGSSIRFVGYAQREIYTKDIHCDFILVDDRAAAFCEPYSGYVRVRLDRIPCDSEQQGKGGSSMFCIDDWPEMSTESIHIPTSEIQKII